MLIRAADVVVSSSTHRRRVLRLLSGLGANSYSNLVGIASQVLLLPILLNSWGVAQYGVWLTLSALGQYIAYANIGLPGAARAEVARQLGQGDSQRASTIFCTAIAFTVALSIIAAIVVAITVGVAPISRLLNIPEENLGFAKPVVLLICAQVVLATIGGIAMGGVAASGYFAASLYVDANRQLLETVLVGASVLFFKGTPVTVAAVYAAAAAAQLAIAILMIFRLAPFLVTGRRPICFSALKTLWSQMIGVLAMSLGYYGLTIQAPRVVLAMVVGPVGVAQYAVSVMMMRIVRIPLGVVAHVPTVEIATAHGRGDEPVVRALVAGNVVICGALAVILLPVVWFLGPVAAQIWTGHLVVVSQQLLLLGGLATCAFALALPCQEALLARGELGRVSAPLLLLMVPFLGVLYFAAGAIGPLGAASAVLALETVYALITVVAVWRSHRFSPDVLLPLAIQAVRGMTVQLHGRS